MKVLFLIVLITSAAGPAFGGAGDVINYFSLPGVTEYGPRGLAYDPDWDVYYVTTPVGPNNVRVIKFTYDGSTASVVSSFSCDSELYWPMDAAWENNLAVAEDLLGETDPARVLWIADGTGDLVSSFAGPYDPADHLNGLTWTGSSLFASSYDSTVIYELTTTGSVISSFEVPKDHVNGLAYGAGYLWAITTEPHYEVYKLTTTGSIVASYAYDADDAYVGGACWARDDMESLFVATFSGDKYIYEIGFAEDTTVLPATLGRIKALYR